MDETKLSPFWLTDDDLANLKEIFEEFDKEKNGNIRNDSVKTCVQLFGQNPSDLEIDKALARLEVTSPGQLTFDEFKNVVRMLSKPKQRVENEISDSLSTIIPSLKSSDGDIFNKEELKLFLQKQREILDVLEIRSNGNEERGDEPLLQEEIDDLFNDLDPNNKTDTLSKTQLMELLNTQF